MQFSVGDKVVHPSHGPGTVTSVEQKDLLAGEKDYYVIEIPSKSLTVFVPRKNADGLGVRPAMRQSTMDRVFRILRSRPRSMPGDYRERQELAWEQLRTNEPASVARVVRDLTGHGISAHLTRKDAELLDRGTDLLAGEMALVTDQEIADARAIIQAALTPAEEAD